MTAAPRGGVRWAVAGRTAARRWPRPLRRAGRPPPRQGPGQSPGRGDRRHRWSRKPRGRWTRRCQGRRRGDGLDGPGSPPPRRPARPAPRGSSSGLPRPPPRPERRAARKPSTAEELLHSLDKRGEERNRGSLRSLAQLLEKLALALRELLRHLDDDLVDDTAASPAAEVRHALALERQPLPGLRAGRHMELCLPVEHRDVHEVTQAHLRIRQRQLADQVGALADEDLVRADLDQDVEVARGSAEETAFALPSEPQLVAVFHTRRNGDLEELLARDATLATAVVARVAVESAGPGAGGTRPRHRQEPLGEADLPLAAARATDIGGGAGHLARASAGLAGLVPRDLDLGLDPACRFLQRDLEPVLEIGATPRARAPAATTSAPEEALDQVLEHRAEARLESGGSGARPGHRAEAIVLRPLVRIGEHAVGLADLLEALLGSVVARILVGVELAGEGAVGVLERGVVGVAPHAEEGVVVLGRHARKRGPAPWPP